MNGHAAGIMSAAIPEPPAIESPPPREPRPFWSVMMPVYNPTRSYFEAALRSVLDQDPGPAEMQICVVDDCSSDGAVEEVVRRVGGGRVEFHRRTANGGLALAWNTGVNLAAGRWVHLLHQDDLVLPGFYERLRHTIEDNPELGAAYVQHYLLDSDGRPTYLMSRNPATKPGVVDDWLEWVYVQLSIQTPSIVVKREAYERLGGFRAELRFALDWDMWKRIAAVYPIWFDPEPLAGYRRHSGAVSMDFLRSGQNMEEVRRSIDLSREYLPEADAERVAEAARAVLATYAVDAGLNGLFVLRDWRIAAAQLRQARKSVSGLGFSKLVLQRFIAGVGRWVDSRRRQFQLPRPGT